jgi:hypothetical protein
MNQQDAFDIVGIIHRKWSEAMKDLLAVKAKVDDGSPDWKYFHNSQRTSAENYVEHYAHLKEVFLKDHPLEEL